MVTTLTGRDYISWSALSTFRTCPLKYKFRYVDGLPDTYARALPLFIFTTSGLPFLATFWHRTLKHALARKGYEVVGEFACRGFDTWGPLWLIGGLNWRHPNERDCQRAREFAGRVAHAGIPT